jgi:filamentous hemagglutinin
MIFVEEGGDQRLRGHAMSAAEDFDAGTSGAMSDRLTGRRVVPALRYTNDITSGLGVKRFDGYEGTHVLSLIDAKYNLDSMQKGRKSNLDMQRMISALEQNPSFKAILETHTQARSLRLEQKLEKIFDIQPKGNSSVRTR